MKIIKNKVLVAIDNHISNHSGFEIVKRQDKQHHYSVRGTVVGVPKDLFFDKTKMETVLDLPRVRELNAASMSYKTEMELKVGDRILFSYRAHFEMPMFGDLGLMDYDMIIAAIEKEKIRPINGYLLIEMAEKEMFENIDGFQVYNEDKNIYGYGKVRYAGSPVEYLDYDDIDDENITEGSVVIFDKRSAARIELDIHNSLTQQQSSLFKMHRKDVLLYE